MTLVSWIILTFNRGDIVKKSVTHNFDNMGFDPKDIELVWVDNGSTDRVTREFMSSMDPEVSVIYNENKGVSKGYNAGLGMARGDYVVITGCDIKMPDNWLGTFMEYVTKIPQTGVACIYTTHWTLKPERLKKGFGVDTVNDLGIVHAMPVERRIFKRSMLAEFGYFPESFGLYGYDDIAWAQRAERVCDANNLIYYVIPDHVAEHMGTEGVARHTGKGDDAEYHKFKKREAEDPEKMMELGRLKRLGWPRFTPFY